MSEVVLEFEGEAGSVTDKKTGGQQVCRYCQGIIESPRHFVFVDGLAAPVCCPGCQRNFEMDQSSLIETQPRETMSVAEVAAFTATLRGAGPNRSGLYSVSILVPDIRCASCAWLIESSLRKLNEVADIKVSLADKKVYLELTQPGDLENVLITLKSLGYSPLPDQPNAQAEALKAQRKSLLSRLGVAGIGMMQVMMFSLATYVAGPGGMDPAYQTLFRWASLALAVPVTFYSASVFHTGALRDLRRGQVGMDVPVSLAILSAFTLSAVNTLTSGEHVYFDTVCMFTFFLLMGRFIEAGSRIRFQQGQDLIEHLLPVMTRVNDDPEVYLPTHEISVGTLVYVNAGEPYPVDGVVTRGNSTADESAFTGEVTPVLKTVGDRVLAGTANLDCSMQVRSQVTYQDSVINQLSVLSRDSALYKPRFALIADQISRYFVAAILGLAGLSGLYWYVQGMSDWILVSLTVLVVSCPCALSLATPIAYTIATTRLREMGVAVCNGEFLERLARVNTVAFDKTGTLTTGKLRLLETRLLSEMALMDARQIAASLEMGSRHPIAHAFGAGTLEVEDLEVTPGKGVQGVINGTTYRIGDPDFVWSGGPSGTKPEQPDEYSTWVLLAAERPIAWFQVGDDARDEAGEVVSGLQALGCEVCLLTGDRSRQGVSLAESLGISAIGTGLSPEDKVGEIAARQAQGEVMLMIGDGINDAAAMSRSDTSIAICPVDSFVSSAADATLLANALIPLVATVSYARQVRRVIAQNIGWAVAYNMIVVPLAVAGMLAPWMAALGMSLSSLLVVLNSNRLGKVS